MYGPYTNEELVVSFCFACLSSSHKHSCLVSEEILWQGLRIVRLHFSFLAEECHFELFGFVAVLAACRTCKE